MQRRQNIVWENDASTIPVCGDGIVQADREKRWLGLQEANHLVKEGEGAGRIGKKGRWA